MTKSNILGLFLLGLALAVGMSVGGYFIGQTMYNAKIALNTAEAKGLAERVVEADHASWTITHRVSGKSRAELPSLYAKVPNPINPQSLSCSRTTDLMTQKLPLACWITAIRNFAIKIKN